MTTTMRMTLHTYTTMRMTTIITIMILDSQQLDEDLRVITTIMMTMTTTMATTMMTMTTMAMTMATTIMMTTMTTTTMTTDHTVQCSCARLVKDLPHFDCSLRRRYSASFMQANLFSC